MDELSLLVWLSRGGKEPLISLMSKYTGSKEEVYTDDELISILENAIADISSKYHIKGIMREYFNAKKRWQNFASWFPKKYTYSEMDTLSSVILSIRRTIFDEEDQNTIERLRKEYLEN